jgi:hypothetical protein
MIPPLPVARGIAWAVASAMLTVALAGCADGTWVGVLPSLLLAALYLTSCADDSGGSCCTMTSGEEGCERDDGTWEYCNYGMVDAGPDTGPWDSGESDATPGDAWVGDAAWATCCVEGRIEACYCGADASACFSSYEECGSGLCRLLEDPPCAP